MNFLVNGMRVSITRIPHRYSFQEIHVVSQARDTETQCEQCLEVGAFHLHMNWPSTREKG